MSYRGSILLLGRPDGKAALVRTVTQLCWYRGHPHIVLLVLKLQGYVASMFFVPVGWSPLFPGPERGGARDDFDLEG